MVVPAFGFSVGDFVAAINLICTVAKALGEVHGADTQYQQARLELSLIEDVLRKVQRLEATPENATTVERIHVGAHACHIPLAVFVAEIGKFELHFSSQQTRQRPVLGHIIRNGRKIQWNIVLDAQLAKLKARIGPQLESISIMLQIAAADKFSGLERDAQESVELGRKISSHLQRLETLAAAQLAVAQHTQDSLVVLRGGISNIMLAIFWLIPTLHRLWQTFNIIARSPSLLLDDNIRVEDALGRVLSLPYAHFKFWSVFAARLRCEFRGKPGEGKVTRNQFHIVNLKRGGDYVLTRNTWDRFILPGANLAMSMLFEDWEVASHMCRGCSTTTDGTFVLAWVQW